MIALLAFILGIWLWDHYFSEPMGYAPGTEEIALVRIDRDLRLADAMADDPVWLKRLAGAGDPRATRAKALQSLQELGKEEPLSPRAIQALAVIKAEHDGLPLRQFVFQGLPGPEPADIMQTAADLANHRGFWWHTKLIEAWELPPAPLSAARRTFAEDSQTLRSRAITVRSSVWLIGLVGLAFLPRTLATLARGGRRSSPGYGGAWPLQLGLIVFLVATLAAIGFSMTLEFGIGLLPGLHPALLLLLDSSARLLPALIALGLLFRRPTHAVRVLGLNRPFDPKIVLGVFSLLIIADQALRRFFASAGESDPAGGLSAGDAGWWGLAFVTVSACLLAPLSEELLYRGVLFRSCWNRLGAPAAAVLSSVVFAALHFYNGYGLASVAIFGLSAALLFAATGSLGASIALHVLYNSAIKIPEWVIYHRPLG